MAQNFLPSLLSSELSFLPLLCRRAFVTPQLICLCGLSGAGPQVFWGAGANPQSWEQLLRMWGVSADPAKIQEMMRNLERGQSAWDNMNEVRDSASCIRFCAVGLSYPSQPHLSASFPGFFVPMQM